MNNQYNSAFWCLVAQGKTTDQAYQILKGTDKNFKNDLLFNTFQLNYNNLPNLFKKGSTLIRKSTNLDNKAMGSETSSTTFLDNKTIESQQEIDLKIEDYEINTLTELNANVELVTDDIINEEFWNAHFWVIDSTVKPPKLINNQ